MNTYPEKLEISAFVFTDESLSPFNHIYCVKMAEHVVRNFNATQEDFDAYQVALVTAIVKKTLRNFSEGGDFSVSNDEYLRQYKQYLVNILKLGIDFNIHDKSDYDDKGTSDAVRVATLEAMLDTYLNKYYHKHNMG